MTVVTMPREVFKRTRWQRQYLVNILITDVLVVGAAVVLAQYVRFGQAPDLSGTDGYITFVSILFGVIWLGALSLCRTRSARVIGAGAEEYKRVASASFWTFGGIAIITFLLQLEIARGYLAVALPTGTVALCLTRWLWRRYLAKKRAEGHYQTAVMAIGDADAVTYLAQELTRDPRAGYDVVAVGIPGYGAPAGERLTVGDRDIPIMGGEEHVLDAIRECGADTVAVTGVENFGYDGIRKLMWDLEAMGVDLVVSPGVMDVSGARLEMRPVAGFPLVHVEKPQYDGAKRFEKRAFDFVFAAFALVVASPILLIAAIAIKLDSRGSVFYTAERIGIDGRPFAMLKFRTMVSDADRQLESLQNLNESSGGVLFKIKDDPRVTSVGKVLRRFSIDELPQFVNVLRQEMSVVGPRPPLRQEVETYDGDVQRRLLVKPGITGLWQVSGRADLSWRESVRLDLSYVENWSMVADLVIIAKTVRAVLLSQGAY
ncbi:sugar transferase [Mycobacterium sp. DL440]|uniref:sugar transferase n=1 Tax=Mycobacterium sp. DL440 TaxID=2675523 RepID=UPI00142336A6